MSTNLDLLSDSTFGTKLDEQNAILEDIRDSLGGNLAGSIATIETSPAATTHIVGEYIYYNTKLYKVIAAIALGDTLTVGTNIAETKVMDEIPTVTNSIASGNTDVPTSGAVYNAIQSGGLGSWLLPKPYGEATKNDDFFISKNGVNTANPLIANYTINGNLIIANEYGDGAHLYLYFKRSAFNIDTTPLSILGKITIIPTGYAYSTTYSGNIYPNITTIHNTDSYNAPSGYVQVGLQIYLETGIGVGNKFKIIYTP